jgi:hypothetical protein
MKHQEKERRSERFGVKFMKGDIPGRGGDQHRASQEQRCLSIETESLSDAECYRPHRSECGVLHYDKDQWMAENDKKWSDQKNDRLHMITEQRDTFN